MKRAYIAIITVVLAVAVVTVGSRLRAHADESGGISLKKLAGNFAGQSEANYGLCFNDDFSALRDCATTPDDHVIAWRDSAVNQCTSDTNGNSCCEAFDTNALAIPFHEPANNNHYIISIVTTSYNSSTGSGNSTFTEYDAGPGVKCNGSTLVNTANAPIVVSGTQHVVVSDNGNRGDAVILTIQLSPINGVSQFVGHSFALRQ